jgi:hypothetical protein
MLVVDDPHHWPWSPGWPEGCGKNFPGDIHHNQALSIGAIYELAP